MEVRTIKAYLAENGITMKEFAEKLECNRSYLSRIANGAIAPSPRLARDINRLTDGIIDIKRTVAK